ncbi:MAG: hypothetical protein QOG43_384 [Actinomycetota bacterium]|nr:hypothetical protein [Actinomycetota bacterium]
MGSDAAQRLAFSGGPPGSRRSPCLGCGHPVRPSRDAYVEIGGSRDGSWLALLDAEPGIIRVTDSTRMPDSTFHLGFAHRACAELARRRLIAHEVDLPDGLVEILIDDITDEPSIPPLSLDIPPRPGECPFCEFAPRISEEHVYPAWMTREFRRLASPSQRPFVFSLDGSHPRATSTIDLTVPVCGPCNNRWLSVLENDVAPLLGPMLRGEDRDLSLNNQRLLATWAVKTALLLNLVQSEKAFIPTGCFREFRQQRQPLGSTVVWIGAYSGRRWAAWARQIPLYLGKPGPDKPNAFLTTFTAMRVVFQVLGHFTSGNMTIHDERLASLALHSIWPPRGETLHWPRVGLAFGDDDLSSLAASFGGG